jgi:hypothetical protein
MRSRQYCCPLEDITYNGMPLSVWFVARYEDADWRRKLAVYIDAKIRLRQLETAKRSIPPGGPSWSAWQRHIERLRRDADRDICHARKWFNSCLAALGPLMPVWKARPARATDGRIARQYKGKYTNDISFAERETRWAANCTPAPEPRRQVA